MMLVFKPCENFLPLLLLPPKLFTTTTNSEPHLLHLHQHQHRHVKLHFSPLKAAHFKSTALSSPPAPAADSSSLTTTTTAGFLMDSGGLSYVEAIEVIRQVPTVLNNGGRKPRSVIAYFESIGFSKTHISKAISNSPKLLVADLEKTLKPKIQLFQDIGFSDSDIAELIASKSPLLHRSLQNLITALDFIKSFVKTDEDLIKTIKRKNNGILLRSTYDRESIEANLDVLRQHGVPDSEIVHMVLTRLPAALMSTPERFKTIVERIVSLGFKPETRKFLTGVVAMSGLKKATWDSKVDLLKSLGWSDEQIHDAFRRFPGYLKLSGEKMKEGIEFFKESLNWDASVLSQYPFILYYSLKIRVIPRYAVFKCLMSKEIITDDKLFTSMLKLTETHFLSTYVFKYQEQLPHLYEVYKKECMLGCEVDNGEITNQQDHGDVDMTV